jgi:hypothetical protein
MNTREYILEFINAHAGFRLLNVQNGTASQMDREILDEALGFRSLCLFSALDDKQLKKLWDASSLEYIL